MDRKPLLSGLEIKQGSEETGAVRAVFSVFNVVDSQGDIMLPGSIPSGQEVALIWSHDWGAYPVGKGQTVVNKDRAVFEGRFFTDTQAGLEAYRTVKNMGSLQEYSFGFQVRDAEFGQHDGQPVRLVKAVELFEVSPVLIGANRQTGTLAIKSAADCACDSCQRVVFDALSPDEKLSVYYDTLDTPTDLKAVWSTAFVNSLPDSSFAIIEPGGEKDEDGKTTPRSLRHFPHHDSGGSLDAPHVRNGLARVPQSSLSDELKGRAEAHLRRHADAMNIGKSDASTRGERLQEHVDRVLADIRHSLTDADGLYDRILDLASKRALERHEEKVGTAISQRRRHELDDLAEVAESVAKRIRALLAEADRAKDDAEESDDAESGKGQEAPPTDPRAAEIEAMYQKFTALDSFYRDVGRHKEHADAIPR